jgi:hypothetical protein
MRGIAAVHFRKGSLLEYDGVYLSEGPWPAKAQWDAHRLARQRDASHYLNYGFTRPKVISRGKYNQNAGDQDVPGLGGSARPSTTDPRLPGEIVPTPAQVGPDAAATEAPGDDAQAAVDTSEKRGFEWGSLGLGTPTKQVAPPASGNQDKGNVASLKIVRETPPRAIAASSGADSGVQQAAFQSDSSSDTNEAAADQPTSAINRPTTGWQTRKR